MSAISRYFGTLPFFMPVFFPGHFQEGRARVKAKLITSLAVAHVIPKLEAIELTLAPASSISLAAGANR
jgi:hypothetical protein